MNPAVIPSFENPRQAIQFLSSLSDDAPAWSAPELARSWFTWERSLLAQLREEERQQSPSLQAAQLGLAAKASSEHDRIRNLVWEISVSIDLCCVHVRAVRKLAAVLNESELCAQCLGTRPVELVAIGARER